VWDVEEFVPVSVFTGNSTVSRVHTSLLHLNADKIFQ